MLAVFSVTTELDVVAANDGLTSLREAVATANLSPGSDSIAFDPSLSGKTITLAQGEIELTDALTISGPGANALTIDAQQLSRIFNITTETGDFAIRGLTLSNGRTTADNVVDATGTIEGTLNNGGAVRSMSYGALTLDDMRIDDCHTMGFTARGGGVFARGAVVMTGCSLIGNSTSGKNAEGGGLWAIGDLTMVGCTVRDNHTYATGAAGGGVSNPNYSATVSISDSVIENNNAVAIGGGVSTSGTLLLTRSTISGNSTSGNAAHGGGVYAVTTVVTDCVITDNSATGHDAAGGGLNAARDAKIIRSTISHNTAGELGGGIHVRGNNTPFGAAPLIVEDSVITDNVAGYQGGGIQVPGRVVINTSVVARNRTITATGGVGGGVRSYDITVSDSLFDSNESAGAGAIYGSNVTIFDSTFTSNRGIGGAGGAILTDGAATIVNSTFSGNSGLNGGALAIWGGNLTLRNSTVTRNSATKLGGGIQALKGSAISNSIVAGNTAASGRPDLDVTGTLTADYSIIGDKSGTTLGESHTPDAHGNLVGSATGGGIINPLLSPIADNGGRTFLDGSKMRTVALLPGSPAIDRGNPAFNPADPDGVWYTSDSMSFDGRGTFFSRVSNFRLDIGAFEVQSTAQLVGDFNQNGRVDNDDYLIWRNAYGSVIRPFYGADVSGNGVVGSEDYVLWRAHNGEALPIVANGAFIEESVVSLAAPEPVPDTPTSARDGSPRNLSAQLSPAVVLIEGTRRPRSASLPTFEADPSHAASNDHANANILAVLDSGSDACDHDAKTHEPVAPHGSGRLANESLDLAFARLSKFGFKPPVLGQRLIAWR